MQKGPVGAEAFDQIVFWVSQAIVIVVEAPSAALVQLGGSLHPDGLVGAQVVELIAPTRLSSPQELLSGRREYQQRQI